MNYKTSLRKRRGFTLTELAIVMALIGIVLGGIWAAAGSVSQSDRILRTSRQIIAVAQNVREYYLNADGIPGACANTGITNNLFTINVIPVELHVCSGAACRFESAFASGSPALGNTFDVMGSTASCVNGKASRFRVVLKRLTPAACTRLLFSEINFKDASLGVERVCASADCENGTWSGALTCTGGVCSIAGYNSLAEIQNRCNSSLNQIGWEFKLRN